MRCPICGAKMVQGQLCKYCHITSDQVKESSNKKVKDYRRADMEDLICFTTYVPNDISRLKLILYTIFLGLFGVNHYYVKRNIRGTFSVLSFALSMIFMILKLCISTLSSVIIFEIFYEASLLAMTVNIFMWICDIINVLTKRFKIPVVLGEKEKMK